MSTHTKTQNNPKAIFFVVVLFIAVGLTFVVSGIYLGAQHKNIDDGRIHTTATIVDIQEELEVRGHYDYTVYVVYSVDGEEVLAQLSGYISSYYVGEELEIYYYLDDLSRVHSEKGMTTLSIAFPVAGAISIAVGVAALVLFIKQKKSTYTTHNSDNSNTNQRNGNNNTNQSTGKKARANKKSSFAFTLFITLFALLMLGIGVYLILSICDVDDGKRVYTTATITEVIEHRGADGEIIYCPYVSYEVDGTIIETEIYENAPELREGTVIGIYYYPQKPQKATIVSKPNILDLLFPIGFSCFALFMSSLGIATLIGLIKDRKNEVEDTGSDRTDDNGNAIGYDSTIDYPFE